MFFLTYVKDEKPGGLRVVLPDFDLYTMAVAVAEVPDRLQDEIADQYKGRVPRSSDLEDLQDDPRFHDGWWLWLNIDVDDVGRRRGPRVAKRVTKN
jgi:hypothetical protein